MSTKYREDSEAEKLNTSWFDDTSERVTGKSKPQWKTIFAKRRLKGIESGTLALNRTYSISERAILIRTYDLSGDDFVDGRTADGSRNRVYRLTEDAIARYQSKPIAAGGNRLNSEGCT